MVFEIEPCFYDKYMKVLFYEAWEGHNAGISIYHAYRVTSEPFLAESLVSKSLTLAVESKYDDIRAYVPSNNRFHIHF